ncbi:nucleotidyltransferase family protein, partial [Actinotalea ferrariae]|uniref:nucleotidyltransferase family protein n=1 Tax=Actinotalea ferrariae TaxID=1386098 RepID=UPI001C8C4A6E
MSADDVVCRLFRDAAGTSGVATSDAPAVTSAGDAARLVRLLDAHRGWTYLAPRADRVAGLPAALVDRATRERRAAVSYQIALGADLRTCGDALDVAGIPWACVKGPVVAALHERRGDVRPFTDLDLLVPPARFADALRALSGAGAVLLDRNFALLRERTPGEVNVRAPLGTMVDLHWTLVNRRERRTRSRVATAPLLAGRVPVPTSAGDVPALAPAERLVHLCLHAAGSGAGRLVWLLDVALSVADAVDWDAVVAVARAWGVPHAVGLVLGRSRTVLGADVPADVVRALLG